MISRDDIIPFDGYETLHMIFVNFFFFFFISSFFFLDSSITEILRIPGVKSPESDAIMWNESLDL